MMTIEQAKRRGMIAYENGEKAQSGADSELTAAIRTMGMTSTKALALMQAWHNGWHEANINADY